jgi:hypothetical protein
MWPPLSEGSGGTARPSLLVRLQRIVSQNFLSNLTRHYAKEILQIFASFALDHAVDVITTDGFIVNFHMESF